MSLFNVLIGEPVTGQVPPAPTIGTASAVSSGTVHVTYTPILDGGNTITSYTAISSPGSITSTDTTGSGTITVTGLTDGTTYTFQVYATNVIGNGPNSSSSNSVTNVIGNTAITSTGINIFVVSPGVTNISAVAVGGGGAGYAPNSTANPAPNGVSWYGGGGGALAYANNIAVTPGATLLAIVGPGGSYTNPGASGPPANYSQGGGDSALTDYVGTYTATSPSPAGSTISVPSTSGISPGNYFYVPSYISSITGGGGIFTITGVTAPNSFSVAPVSISPSFSSTPIYVFTTFYVRAGGGTGGYHNIGGGNGGIVKVGSGGAGGAGGGGDSYGTNGGGGGAGGYTSTGGYGGGGGSSPFAFSGGGGSTDGGGGGAGSAFTPSGGYNAAAGGGGGGVGLLGSGPGGVGGTHIIGTQGQAGSGGSGGSSKYNSVTISVYNTPGALNTIYPVAPADFSQLYNNGNWYVGPGIVNSVEGTASFSSPTTGTLNNLYSSPAPYVSVPAPGISTTFYQAAPGLYGGGGGGSWTSGGAQGAIRIIWGAGRSFPNNAT
jgi:Fibronectin type III domain